jgi:hypothetical protein
MPCTSFRSNPAQRRYIWRFFSTTTAYVLLFAVSNRLFRTHRITGLGAVVLAMAPALAIVASIAVVGLYLAEEQDEFVRSVLVRSMLWGIAGTLAFATVYGFIEQSIPAENFPLYGVYPLFWILTGLAQAAHEFYYRRAR